MDAYLQSTLQNIAMEQLSSSKIGMQLESVAHSLEKAYQHLCALHEKQDELEMTGVKAATMITFAILKKIAEGKLPAALDSDDWKDIAEVVSEYVILGDDQSYSVMIFGLYERYIRFSVGMISDVVPQSVSNSVISLADELRQKSTALKSGCISEPAYTEDCLWISLEAMIKLFASTAALAKDERVTEFTQAIAAFAFEYGRLMLYRREQEIVNLFLESQSQLDAELETKYAAYIDDLAKESEQFYLLIDNAFAPDFKEAFLHSFLLAKAAGVQETDILSSSEDIDAFFLD